METPAMERVMSANEESAFTRTYFGLGVQNAPQQFLSISSDDGTETFHSLEEEPTTTDHEEFEEPNESGPSDIFDSQPAMKFVEEEKENRGRDLNETYTILFNNNTDLECLTDPKLDAGTDVIDQGGNNLKIEEMIGRPSPRDSNETDGDLPNNNPDLQYFTDPKLDAGNGVIDQGGHNLKIEEVNGRPSPRDLNETNAGLSNDNPNLEYFSDPKLDAGTGVIDQGGNNLKIEEVIGRPSTSATLEGVDDGWSDEEIDDFMYQRMKGDSWTLETVEEEVTSVTANISDEVHGDEVDQQPKTKEENILMGRHDKTVFISSASTSTDSMNTVEAEMMASVAVIHANLCSDPPRTPFVTKSEKFSVHTPNSLRMETGMTSGFVDNSNMGNMGLRGSGFHSWARLPETPLTKWMNSDKETVSDRQNVNAAADLVGVTISDTAEAKVTGVTLKNNGDPIAEDLVGKDGNSTELQSHGGIYADSFEKSDDVQRILKNLQTSPTSIEISPESDDNYKVQSCNEENKLTGLEAQGKKDLSVTELQEMTENPKLHEQVKITFDFAEKSKENRNGHDNPCFQGDNAHSISTCEDYECHGVSDESTKEKDLETARTFQDLLDEIRIIETKDGGSDSEEITMMSLTKTGPVTMPDKKATIVTYGNVEEEQFNVEIDGTGMAHEIPQQGCCYKTKKKLWSSKFIFLFCVLLFLGFCVFLRFIYEGPAHGGHNLHLQ